MLSSNNPQLQRNPYSSAAKKNATGIRLPNVYVYTTNNINNTPGLSQQQDNETDAKPASDAVQENSS